MTQPYSSFLAFALAIVCIITIACVYNNHICITLDVKEPFSVPICLPDSDCLWGAEQTKAILNKQVGLYHVTDATPWMNTLRQNIIEYSIQELRNHPNFITFFDEESFKGKMHIIAVPPTPVTTVIEAQTLTFSVKARELSPLELFAREFDIYYGRRYSVIVPPNVSITLRPVAGGGVFPSEPVVIRPGQHPSMVYHRAPLRQIEIDIIKPLSSSVPRSPLPASAERTSSQ